MQVLGIVDHKIIHNNEDDDENPIEYKPYGKNMMITSTAWRNNSNAACGGVGILLNKVATDALAEVVSFNNRILIANFGGNPEATVIVHYVPCEGADNAEEHYQHLTDAVHTVPKHNMILIVGDCNAHTGSEDALFSFHETTNNNGKLLLEFAEENNLMITNTRFQKKRGKLWTYISDMNGLKSQIDYILVNKKWKNSIRNVEAYSSFSSLGTDHRVLSARIKLSLRTSKTPSKKMYDWYPLREDTNLQQLYTVTVKNRYSELQDNSETLTELYQHLITANQETAEKMIPVKKKKPKKKASVDPRVVSCRKKVQEAFEAYTKDASEENQIQLQSEKELLQQKYQELEEEDLNEMIDQVETADKSCKHGESWKLINKISGRKNTKSGILKGKNKEERVKNWYLHFSLLLGKEPIVDDEDEEIQPVFTNLRYKTGPFDIDEYQAAKKRLKEGKAAGQDGIPPEVLKRCDIDDIVLKFANKLLLNLEKPDQWSESNLIPIAKSGDLRLGGNYRGIMLNSLVLKITNKMMLNRIQPTLDPHLRPNQNGFRPGRTTTAQILALRRIIEGVKSRNLSAIITFIDFRKAFDSIHRGKMLKILRAYGIPDELVNAIAKTYENTKARVLSPDGETELFEILAGVLQGDTLAPYLFAITLDYAMREAIGNDENRLGFTIEERKSRRTPATSITDLDFADDIALISDQVQETQELLTRIEKATAKVGLCINVKKTVVMPFHQTDNVEIKTREGVKLKSVEEFKYLGAWMSSSEKDFNTRKAQAWTACHKLHKVWKSKLPRSTKIRLFVSTVESVLLYGSETWTITKQMEKKIDGCYTRLLRMALNISWQQHLTNEACLRCQR